MGGGGVGGGWGRRGLRVAPWGFFSFARGWVGEGGGGGSQRPDAQGYGGVKC